MLYLESQEQERGFDIGENQFTYAIITWYHGLLFSPSLPPSNPSPIFSSTWLRAILVILEFLEFLELFTWSQIVVTQCTSYNSSCSRPSWSSESLTTVLTASVASLILLFTFSPVPFSVAAGAAWPSSSSITLPSLSVSFLVFPSYASTLCLPFSLINWVRSSTVREPLYTIGSDLPPAGKSLIVGNPWISSGTSLAVASTLAIRICSEAVGWEA